MSSKQEKIEKIIALLNGKEFEVINPRPELNFQQIEPGRNLYICSETGEKLLMDEIFTKYPGLPNEISGVKVIETRPGQNYSECTKVKLLRIKENQILIK